jgi:hypothetical protein
VYAFLAIAVVGKFRLLTPNAHVKFNVDLLGDEKINQGNNLKFKKNAPESFV